MKTILLIGLGVEGRAAARFFLHKGDTVLAADTSAEIEPCPVEFSAAERFHWITEAVGRDSIHKADLILRSPGIPPAHQLVASAIEQGHKVTTPTGFWLAHHAPDTTITVTGTKGKSTTVTLIVRLLQALGLDAAPHGNIGLPPLDETIASADYPVLELSSYMLHDIPDGPYTHVVTNLFREHTPWHGSEASYHEAKLRPFRFMPPRPGIAPQHIITAHHMPSSIKALEDLAPIKDQQIGLGEIRMTIDDLPAAFQQGPLLIALQNAIAATRMVRGQPVPIEAVLKAAHGYKGLPSRQEKVASTDDRDWINDALATVPEAVLHVLMRFKGRQITLLLGGADREQDFGVLAQTLATQPHITPLIFGSTAPRLERALSAAKTAFTRCGTYEDALSQAARITPKGGMILFSPAAASEAPHGNFSVRAEIFRAAAAGA